MIYALRGLFSYFSVKQQGLLEHFSLKPYVMNVSGMDCNRQQATQHIRYDVPFSAFRLFSPSIPACSMCSCASPVYSGDISSHCSSAKSPGYGSLTFRPGLYFTISMARGAGVIYSELP